MEAVLTTVKVLLAQGIQLLKQNHTKKLRRVLLRKKFRKKKASSKAEASTSNNDETQQNQQANSSTNNQNTISNSNNQQSSKQTQNTNQGQSQSTAASNNNQQATTNQQAATVITTADQARSLVAHANGGASPASFSVEAKPDGYHVYLNNLNNPIVTVVKPNGDFYDVNGNLTGKYSNMAAPDGGDNSQWTP
ncbi:hypothetical protein [Companilactobacillus kimchii]|uniref:hypothetical protein n=1 Tax=Companilactobacillus kimchii TaxID=2801452 RepID=UPI0006D07568|nr:hypothetical protein [Companilactobacillus kimchii]